MPRSLPRCAAIVSALLLSAAAGAQDAGEPIRATAIRQDVRILSGDAFAGRGPGENGEARTLEHLRGQFAAAGLKPGGPDGSWYQDVPLIRRSQTGVAATLAVGGRMLPMRKADDWTLTAAPPGTSRIADAPLTFAGFGVQAPEAGHDDFAGVDLTGRIVVVLMNDPDYDQADGPFGGRVRSEHAGIGRKARIAAERGAVGMIQVFARPLSTVPWKQFWNRDGEPGYRLATAAEPAAPPFPVITIRDTVAQALFGAAGLDLSALSAAARRPGFRAVALPGATATLSATLRDAPFLTRNIIARLDGTARADETLVYGAHWDAYGTSAVADPTGDRIRNGAVDNAIGTAELLEVARAFARGPRPARTLLFIGFTSEEDGLLGAYHYAANPVRPLATTAAMLNLDPHVAFPRTRSIELFGAGKTPLEADLARIAGRMELAIEGEANPADGWYNRSDHLAFASAGVPTVYFRAGRDLAQGGRARGNAIAERYNDEDYHQREDEFDPAWDFAAAAQEATLAYRLGREIADGGRWPEWRADAPYTAKRAETAAARRGADR